MIRGSVVLLRKPELPEARKLRYIKAIADTTDRATRLTSQLLAFARRSALQPQIIDARNGVEVLAPMLRKLSGSRIKAIHRIFRRLTQAHVSAMKAESVNGDRVCAATDGGRRQRLDVNCSHPGREINRNHLVAADPGSLEKQLLHSLGKGSGRRREGGTGLLSRGVMLIKLLSLLTLGSDWKCRVNARALQQPSPGPHHSNRDHKHR